MSTLETLVGQLEALRFETQLVDPESLLAALAERQALLTQVQSVDIATLPAALRVDLKARLQAVLARDAEVLEQLKALHAETKHALEQLKPARAATRAYREAAAAPAQATRRIG